MTDWNRQVVVQSNDVFHVSRDMIAQIGAHRLASLILEELGSNDAFRNKVLMALKDLRQKGHIDLSNTSNSIDDEPHFVGDSPAMHEAFAQIRKFAVTDLPVLVTGESGTGKELVASAIHERSSFSNGPFVAVNCGGLPSTLIASELFGYEKGAFTGANQRKMGRIEAAEGGTLFLDEIGDLPLELQGHLLRFLQEKTIDRVGSQRPVPVNVRIIAATNRDLMNAVESGSFRLDLYYRLKVLHIHLPPLRERDGDVEILTRYFIKKFSHELHSPIDGVEPDALGALVAYSWPGNVRELISTLRRAIVIADGNVIRQRDLILDSSIYLSGNLRESRTIPDRYDMAPSRTTEREADNEKTGLFEVRSRSERELLANALVRNRHNVTRTAKELGVSRVTLYRLMDKHSLRSM